MPNPYTKEDEEKMGAEYDQALADFRADVAAWDTSRPEVLRIALEFLRDDLEGHLRRARAAHAHEAAQANPGQQQIDKE